MALTAQQQARVTDLQVARDGYIALARAKSRGPSDTVALTRVAYGHKRHAKGLTDLRAQLTAEGVAPGDLPSASPTRPTEFATDAAVDAALGPGWLAYFAGPQVLAQYEASSGDGIRFLGGMGGLTEPGA